MILALKIFFFVVVALVLIAGGAFAVLWFLAKMMSDAP